MLIKFTLMIQYESLPLRSQVLHEVTLQQIGFTLKQRDTIPNNHHLKDDRLI